MSFLSDPGRRRVAIVLLLFVLSVLARLPYLNRPLSSHHEGLTAHVLRTQQIWREAGALKHGFRLVCTYPGKADRNIHNGGQLVDPGGSYYKSSLPPFAYIFPYLVFRLLGVRPDVLPIQVFGLLVHLVTCVLVLLLVRELTRPDAPARGPRGPSPAAMVAFAVYLFSPQTLWYHSNVYAFGMLALPLFVAGVLLSLKIAADRNAGPARHALLGLVTFLMVYTDWLGVFFAFSVFVYALYRARERRMRPVLYVVAGATAAGLALTVWQYSRIAGLSAFLRAAGGKYLERSGFAEAAGGGPQVWDFVSWKALCGHYVFGYLPFLIVLHTLACVYLALLRKRPGRSGLRRARRELLALYLCAAPVALHHVVFFNYTSVHAYSVLKTGVFVAILCGLLYHRIMAKLRADASDDNRAFKAGALGTLVVLMAVMSVVQYLYLNRDGHDRHLKMGREIARVAKSDEVVFVRPGDRATWRTVPQITFYAHRNIALWAGEEKARALLVKNDCERGAVFILTGDNGAVARVEYVDRGRRERPGDDTTPFNRDRQDIQD